MSSPSMSTPLLSGNQWAGQQCRLELTLGARPKADCCTAFHGATGCVWDEVDAQGKIASLVEQLESTGHIVVESGKVTYKLKA